MLFPYLYRTLYLLWNLFFYVCPRRREDTLVLPSRIKFSSTIQSLSTASAGLAIYSRFTLTELETEARTLVAHKQRLFQLK